MNRADVMEALFSARIKAGVEAYRESRRGPKVQFPDPVLDLIARRARSLENGQRLDDNEVRGIFEIVLGRSDLPVVLHVEIYYEQAGLQYHVWLFDWSDGARVKLQDGEVELMSVQKIARLRRFFGRGGLLGDYHVESTAGSMKK